MTQQDVLEILTNTGALLHGHFELRSGLHSADFFQCANLLRFPRQAEKLCSALAKIIPAALANEAVTVISPALGGILVGHEVARAVGRRCLFTERKDGVMELRRGFALDPREKVLIVEDVVTRGTSLLEVARVVEAAGGVVAGLACIVDRTAGDVELPLPLRSLARVAVESWEPGECPLCRAGQPVTKPGSRGN